MMRFVKALILVSVLLFASLYLMGCGAGSDFYPGGLAVVKRGEWGWTQSSRVVQRQIVQYITIHHTGEERAAYNDPAEYMRSLQIWSREVKGWADIPYHYVIDRDGIVYEGRPIDLIGDSGTDYDLNGHAQVALMGNYELQPLVDRQLESLVKLAAFLAGTFGVANDNIRSHRDNGAATLCPGKNLHFYVASGALHLQIADL